MDLRRIEDLGFHSVAVSEHYSHGWAIDLTAMNFALARTTRLRVMPLVLNNDLHHPGPARQVHRHRRHTLRGPGCSRTWRWLARATTTRRSVSITIPLQSVSRAWTEALQIITAFFDGEPVTWYGEHYQLDSLEALPAPSSRPRPPILVGGGGTKMLALAGRYAT